MKVVVTGATGFIGSHVVAELARAGHDVRLLVRTPEKVPRVLGPLGVRIDDLVAGDMTDPEAVTRALDGCDAVVHAAATFYGGEEVYTANVEGARTLLGLARDRGLDPIVYFSTIAAMYPPPGPVLTVDDPVTGLRTTYGRSKAEGERIARALQAERAPVVTLYPAGVYGPQDPGPSEAMKGLRDGIRWGWPITATGVGVVDVRDLARIAAAALVPGRGPRRFMAGGHYLTWREQAALVERITGRPVRRLPAPPPVLRGLARLLDLAKRVVPFDYPLTYEAALMMTRFVPCDSRATLAELGVGFRPTEETYADSIRWLVEVGELPRRYAGRLA